MRRFVVRAAFVLLLTSPVAHAGFYYSPIVESIVSAQFTADFAGLVAHRTIVGEMVNELLLMGPGGEVLDLSDEFYGTSELLLGETPKIDQGPLNTGWVSAAIPNSFFHVLQGGQVGLQFLATDTDDGLFAIDFLALQILTTGGMVESFINSNDGFGIGLADNSILSAPLPDSIAIDASGTGFDESISSKSHRNELPEPSVMLLILLGSMAFFRNAMK